MNIAAFVISFIPILGPCVYWGIFRNHPSIKPIEEQARMSHRLGNESRRNYDPVFSNDVSDQPVEKKPGTHNRPDYQDDDELERAGRLIKSIGDLICFWKN